MNFNFVVNNKSNNKNWSNYGTAVNTNNNSNDTTFQFNSSKSNRLENISSSNKLYTNHYKYSRNLTASSILSTLRTTSTTTTTSNNIKANDEGLINSDIDCENQAIYNQDNDNFFNSSNSYDLLKSKNLSYKNSELEEQLTLTPEGSMTPENLD